MAMIGQTTSWGTRACALASTIAAATALAATLVEPAFAAPPPNDDFADAEELTGSSDGAAGTKEEATKEPGEPDHAGNPGGQSVWYRWTAPADGDVVIDLCSKSEDDPLLAAYTGANLSGLTEVASDTSHEFCPSQFSEFTDKSRGDQVTIRFPAQEGIVYMIAVDAVALSRAEDFTLGLQPPPPNDEFNDAEEIVGTDAVVEGQNIGATTESGEPPHVASVWYRWTAPYSNRFHIQSCAPSAIERQNVDVYTGDSVDALAPVTDGAPTICQSEFDATAGTTYYISVGGKTRTNFSLSVRDIERPETTILLGPAEGSTVRDGTPTFEFTSDEPSSFECSVDGGPFALCESPYTTPPLGDGAHSFQVRAIDEVGNVDLSPAQRTFTVDRTRPETEITSGPGAGSAISDSSPSFGFQSNEPGSFECKLDGGAFLPCASPRQLGPLSEGQHTFFVKAIDTARNVDQSPASRTFTVDTTNPQTTITSGPAEGSTISNPRPTIDFAANEPSSFECSVDGGPFAPCASPRRLGPLGEGHHAFAVQAKDAAGNVDSSPAIRNFRVDTVAPNTLITAGPTHGETINDPTPTFEFASTEGDSGLQCKLDGGAFAPCSSPLELGPLADGAHTFTVRAIDAAGNVDPVPEARAFSVNTSSPPEAPGAEGDTTPPETTITKGPKDKTEKKTATFEFVSDEAGSTFECSLDGKSTFKPCTSPFAVKVKRGKHLFEVQAIDQAGNGDGSPDTDTWKRKKKR